MTGVNETASPSKTFDNCHNGVDFILDCRASGLLSAIFNEIHDHIRFGYFAAYLVHCLSQCEKGAIRQSAKGFIMVGVLHFLSPISLRLHIRGHIPR
jgi:hypothetical protein